VKKLLLIVLVALLPLLFAAAAHAQTLSWSDEFSGSSVNTHNWYVYSNTKGNDELATCKTSNVTVANGLLAITARKSGRSYTSGELASNPTFTSGSMQACIEVPGGKGIWPAFWLLGNNIDSVGWPACGELDAMESIGTASTIYGSVHSPAYNQTTKDSSGIGTNCYNVYAVTWTPYIVQFSVNGTVYATDMPNQAAIFGKPFFVIFNVAVGGDWPGNPNSTTKFPVSMYVAWVHYYTN